MFFIIAKILSCFTQPSFDLVLLVAVGLALSALRRRRLGQRLAWIGAVGFLAVTFLPVDEWVAEPLEDRFPAVHEYPERVDGIIVLGGALNPELTAVRGMPALGDAAERVTSFVTLARRYPQAKLVFSGGSGSLFGGLPEADAAARLFADLGLDTSRVVLERDSRDTYENAIFSKRLVAPKPDETWVLITSASHMPRAVGIFRHVGWPVLPWPVGYKTGMHRNIHISGPGQELANLDTVSHEWFGLLTYRLLGRTDALFPAP